MGRQIDTSWMDMPEVLSVVFHPRQEYGETPDDGDFTELSIPVAHNVTVGGRFYETGKDQPTILFFHGNGEIVADYADIANLYTSMDINFLPVDYRGYGRSTSTPTVSTMLEDARAVFAFVRDWLKSRELNGPLVVMGRSLGSASALEIAAECRDGVAGVIIESGFSDTVGLLTRLGANITGVPSEDKAMGQTGKIARYNGPLLIIHGSFDQIIPVEDAHALMSACPSESKQILISEGAGHNDLLFRGMKEYMAAVSQFVLCL